MENKKPTICLNMIVKNESKIITRLFDSVLPIIDCYCICDTGSTDNTIELIEEYFKNKKIPGKIVNEPFRNFAHNRNFALNSCLNMSDYVLLLDADMLLEIKDFDKSMLVDNSYLLLQGNENFYYNNLRIVKNDGLSKYIGVTHEYLSTPYPSNKSIGKNQLFIIDIGDGGSKSNKFQRDVELLKKGIEDEPENRERYYFYLANSYFDSNQNELAIETYKTRITYNGYDHEVWYSYYRIGLAYQRMGEKEKAISAWLEGYNYLPLRIENIYEIIKHYRIEGKQKVALNFYEMAKNLLKKINNKDTFLFLQNDVYVYKLDYEYSIIAAWNGIRNINDNLITIFNNCKDNSIIQNTLTNMKFYKDILKPINLIDLSNSFPSILNDKYNNFSSSSSCIIPSENKKGYIGNIRYVNYIITENGSYINCEDNIITINKYIELDENFKIVNEKIFDVEKENRKYIGVEDIKIYRNKNSQILFIGTGYHKNNKIGIVNGYYDINFNNLLTNEIKPNFINSECEKNWVYVNYKNNDFVIYSWYPLLLCSIKDNIQEKTNKKSLIKSQDKSLIKFQEFETPFIFKHVRGSSCGFNYKNEIWFIVHVVSYESPRNYYHMFVKFDENMKLLNYSAPFKFEGEPIEYSLSIIVEYDRIIVNYSTWDRKTKIAIYDKTYIDDKMKYSS